MAVCCAGAMGCSQNLHDASLNYAPTLQVCSAFVVHTLLNSLMLPEKARLTRSSAVKSNSLCSGNVCYS